ncbi:hypothetical protein OPS25_08505 [Alteromonas ponticola]|uniref:Phytanoyl-CoA dioxygenase n=1 Tax=Alteromonas aquimaris TaxID=2998417 RepID=A0ABT3P6Y4_9ALTE|nr:hypothetical protein [Alteromonas aquimaris]MCW8108535.1 hypothetical protein [Alteromonas aquimaris]
MHSIHPRHKPNEVVTTFRSDGLVVLGKLPEQYIDNLRRKIDYLAWNGYRLVHEVADEIFQLSQDPALISLLLTYFKREPKLIKASLFVTGPETGLPDHNQNLFYFDYAGWESLNVFVHLTDVNAQSSFYIYVKGSAQKIGLRDVIRHCVPSNEINDRFNTSVTPIVGAAATIFIENAEGFHRRHKGSECRLLSNLLYTSHGNLLSYGRATDKGQSISPVR